ELWVADDASTDDTASVAAAAGARVVTAPKRLGKGGAATLAAQRVDAGIALLADGDLGKSAAQLLLLVAVLEEFTEPPERVDIAIARFVRRVGGGFGMALRASRWASTRGGARDLEAPLSGQRAIRGEVLASLLPFAA